MNLTHAFYVWDSQVPVKAFIAEETAEPVHPQQPQKKRKGTVEETMDPVYPQPPLRKRKRTACQSCRAKRIAVSLSLLGRDFAVLLAIC